MQFDRPVYIVSLDVFDFFLRQVVAEFCESGVGSVQFAK
jgi:hypothetical protein